MLGNTEQIIVCYDDDIISFYVNGAYTTSIYDKWDIIDKNQKILGSIQYTIGKDIEVIELDRNNISWYNYPENDDIEEYFTNSNKITKIESIALKNKNYELFEKLVFLRYAKWRDGLDDTN